MYVTSGVKKGMNFLLRELFHKFKISDQYFDFPGGNMFWARTKAIYQIFKKDLRNHIPEEKGSKNILYAIERIWLFIVKINGYFYKKYFN